ncbi:MAG: hypothetical protein ACRYE9_04695 [Janthinobacterium lividum]
MISVGILVTCCLNLALGIYETAVKYRREAKDPIPHNLTPADAQSVADLVIQTLGDKLGLKNYKTTFSTAGDNNYIPIESVVIGEEKLPVLTEQ